MACALPDGAPQEQLAPADPQRAARRRPCTPRCSARRPPRRAGAARAGAAARAPRPPARPCRRAGGGGRRRRTSGSSRAASSGSGRRPPGRPGCRRRRSRGRALRPARTGAGRRCGCRLVMLDRRDGRSYAVAILVELEVAAVVHVEDEDPVARRVVGRDGERQEPCSPPAVWTRELMSRNSVVPDGVCSAGPRPAFSTMNSWFGSPGARPRRPAGRSCRCCVFVSVPPLSPSR